MAKTDTTFKISALAAQVQTVGQARAVLGKTADLLRDGYTKLPELTNLGGLRDGFQSSLDSVNALAGGLYAIYSGATPDLFDEEISFQNAAKIGLALERARQVLTEIEDAANVEWWDIIAVLQAALDAVAAAVKWTLENAAKAAAAGAAPLLSAFWPYLLIIAVGALLYFRFGRKLLPGGGN